MTESKARLLVIGAGVNGSVCAAGLHREVDVSVLAALAPGSHLSLAESHATAAVSSVDLAEHRMLVKRVET